MSSDLGLAALTNHSERVPGVCRRDAVELVEALVLRLAVGLGAKVPFAEDRGGVAGVAQHLGHGDFLRRQRDGRPLDRNQRQPGADGIAPRHQGCARRRAGGLDQELRQPQTFGGELVDARRRRPAQLPAAVDPDVAVADVVGENEQDIRLRLLRGCGRDHHGSEQGQQPEPDVSAHVHCRDLLRVQSSFRDLSGCWIAPVPKTIELSHSIEVICL